MSKEHQDVWVCPACIKTFALSNAKTFMAKDADGILECPECHGANFSTFERWTPRLILDGDDWIDPDTLEPWACHGGLSALFDDFYLEVQKGDWEEGLYIVAFSDPGGWRPSEVAVVPVCLYGTPNVWLRKGFGPVRPLIRLAADHYTEG